MDPVTFGSGIFYHDMYILIELRNCLFNTDLQVLTELYLLIKKSDSDELKTRFPGIIEFFDNATDDPTELSGYIQLNKVNKNPILDFYNWGEMNPIGFKDPFVYADSVYERLCYSENETLGVEPVPTLIGNVLRISIELDNFKALYILDDEFPPSIKETLISYFKGSKKVDLLEGTINEAVKEIPEINFVVMENVSDLDQLLVERDHLLEVLIPEFKDNLLAGERINNVPILALPEAYRKNRDKYHIAANSIALPI